MLISDWPKIGEARSRDRWVYGLLSCVIAYLGLSFITEKPWPNLDTVLDLFTQPAKLLVHWLNPTISAS